MTKFSTIAASAAMLATAVASIPTARAGAASGTLSLSLRIVDTCDVRTQLPPGTYPAGAATTPRRPVTRSTCNVDTPPPRVTITPVPGLPASATRKEDTTTGKVKLVTIYF